MEERKKCPFCGSDATVTERDRGFRIECSMRFESCPVNCRTHHFDSIIEAIDAWNTRASYMPDEKVLGS